MMRSSERLRWLEPLGLGITVLALTFQFLIVEPADREAQATRLGALQKSVDLISGRVDETLCASKYTGACKPAFDSLEPVFQDESSPWEDLEAAVRRQAAVKPVIFFLSVCGAILAVIGKAASIRYATK